MINILSPELKRDMKAARINVILVRYSVMLVILAVVIGLVYGLGFWLIMQDERAVNEKLSSQSEESKTYAAVEKEAESFRKNLTIAKSILSKETNYSSFLMTLADDIPDGTILTSLSLGNAPTATAQKGMTLDARVNNYTKVLELKNNLEQSSLFENVNIVSTSRPEDIGELTGLESKYPYEVSYNVQLSAQSNPTQGTKP